MWRGARWLALSCVVVTAALVGPTVALASSCNDGSATSIYSECTQTAKGPKQVKKHSTPPPLVVTPIVVTPVVTTHGVDPHVVRGATHAVVIAAAAATKFQHL